MTDYGKAELFLVDSVDDFWALWDELYSDDNMFVHTRSILLEAFKENTFYSLVIKETDSMYERYARSDSVFCRGACSSYLLPCFCVTNKEGDKILLLWVHSRARRRGFGRQMVEFVSDLHPTSPMQPVTPLPEAYPFWKACGMLQ